MKRNAVLRRAAFFLAASLSAPWAATAGSLSVSPIRIELAAAQRSVTLTVRNDGNQTTLVQTQLVAWSQAEGDDRLEPTTDLLASPPIFSIAPGSVQIVRIALRRAPDAELERSYRILVAEVPGAPQPGYSGAQFALKISFPVFVEASGAKTSPQVEWSGVRTAKGELALTAFNSGTRHLQVRSIDVMSEGKGEGTEADARFAGLWYILPGQRRTVTIAPTSGHSIGAGRVRIRADTDAGILAADVVPDPR